MKNFLPREFNHLAEMDLEFLGFLDEVRTNAALPFYLTSDYRSPATNAAAGGHPASLHLKGMAVDFVTPSCRARQAQGYYAEIWRIAKAIMDTPTTRAVQFEIVKGPTDWHLHLGLYPQDAPNESKIVVTTD